MGTASITPRAETRSEPHNIGPICMVKFSGLLSQVVPKTYSIPSDSKAGQERIIKKMKMSETSTIDEFAAIVVVL